MEGFNVVGGLSSEIRVSSDRDWIDTPDVDSDEFEASSGDFEWDDPDEDDDEDWDDEDDEDEADEYDDF